MSFGVVGLDRHFGDIRALSGVDLAVPAGTVVAVVGGDGAGKSTLLRCLVGRLAPTSGDVQRPDRDEIGYMPATSGTWRDLTIAENVEFVAGAYGMSRAERDRRSQDLLGHASLTDATDRLARDLSGGMRQKLGFVLAMLHRPQLLVLDEPSTGVDPVSRVELWRLIASAAAAGTAIAMATTYLDEAERASAITVLDRGKVIASGTAEELMEAVPGSITAPQRAERSDRSWRRGRTLREWHPAGSTAESPVDDLRLEDAVMARLLADRSSGNGAIKS